MDWAKEIESNRDRLIGIVASLFAMLKLGGSAKIAPIERAFRLEALRILRPAEAAVRRLIVIAAHGVVLKPTVPRPMPAGLSKQLRKYRKERGSRPVFQLADAFVPMVEPVRRRYFKKGRLLTIVLPDDPTVAAIFAARAEANAPPRIDTSGGSPSLVRRLEAIQLALDDLPRQAQRLLRWKERREKIAVKRPIQTSPLRPGRAPYLPKTPFRDVDYVLERCHLLARDVMDFERRADTS